MVFATPPGSGREGGRETYHHGNLRAVLIETALRMISERGLAGFALAEVARAAGVSPAAPYRHFRDRNALVAAVARQGFERFASALNDAWDLGRPDPATAIEACGAAHLAFARREPAAYAAMFGIGFPLENDAALMAASERAFAVVRRAAEAACATVRTGERPPALMVALHVWSLAHGIASLYVEGPERPQRTLPMTAEALLEAGLLVYLQSLGVHRRINGPPRTP